ncbi:MAG: hypothetical protein K2X43_25015 [Hyphomonadaceae bacterium]|jgi:hypothetical protein|nr:hypothetical protein [Hyphomonadaceae bacterium]
MRTFVLRTIGSFVTALAFAGCSHIPDPADIPRVEPYDILQTIRCEIALTLLQDYPEGDPRHLWIREADIAYGLTLTAEEQTTNAGKLGLLWPIHLGTFSLDVSAGKERVRLAENVISLAEEVKAPLALVKGRLPPKGASGLTHMPCAHAQPHAHAYPILGSVGMRDIIRRFVDINKIGSTAAENKLAGQEGKFVHTLKFTLKFVGGVKPSFAIERLDGRKIGGELDLSAHRKDEHQLVVAMAPPAADELVVGPERRRVRRSGRAVNQQLLLNDVHQQQNILRFQNDIRTLIRP